MTSSLVGSVMCIRDSHKGRQPAARSGGEQDPERGQDERAHERADNPSRPVL
jgi:hypothetical protein